MTPPVRPASDRQPTIAVVGGSLTGPITALLLLQAGFDAVTVFEAAPASAPLGGGLIGLERPALDVLDRLGIDQREFVAHDSEAIVEMSIRDRHPAETIRRTYPGRNTTWTLLHHALTRRLPAGVLHTGMKVTALTERAGQPVLRFRDGHTAAADLVVFADGRSSTGRRLLDPHRRLRYAGYVAHRGLAEITPPAGLRDFLRLQPCPGVQFNLAPVPGGCDWTFYLDCTSAEYARRSGADPTRRVFALPRHVSPAARTHVDTHAELLLPAEHAALVRATSTRMAVPVLDITPPERMVWPVGAGHAVLLGDALVPVRPHTARGANNGIEQAAGLVAALTQHRKYAADLPAALHGWQRRHLPAAVAAVHRGAVIGHRLGLGTHQPTP
ncbi:FAD-dependent monooxygenase [Micromonospora sp. C51]|uniref:FAD-dependent monooxygenase n=1 Tax=Micromonospora sp. C51 TaxID=2824879 RepID=UPI001B35C249|nr:FAD-dependent monooxygenase [Micromonospora sp. C51]MBQ1050831.1 FAD-dependent monooxygenase [Micromonospora sp. C51]